MNNFKKSISVFLGIAMLLCSFPVLVYADYQSSVNSFWDYLVLDTDLITGNGLLRNVIGSVSSEAYCARSDDHHHHGDQIIGNSGTDNNGSFTMVHCLDCGDNFKCYASDLSNAYDGFVGTLPATGYDSNGLLTWSPPNTFYVETEHCTGEITSYINGNVIFSITALDRSYSGTALLYCKTSSEIRFPITGTYWRTVYGINPSKPTYKVYHSASDLLFNSNAVIDSSGLPTSSSNSVLPYAGNENLAYYIQPSESQNLYTPSTRVNQTVPINITNVTRTTNYNNTTLVNETTNKYYNVENNTYLDISSWSYDYTSRKYNLTLQDNTTVSVEFGLDCITVIENDVTKTYYYVAPVSDEPEVSPSPSPSPDPGTVEPSPSPSPDPGTDPGGDSDDTGIIAWLTAWWAELKAWLIEFKLSLENKFQLVIEGIDFITNNDEQHNTNIDVTYDNDSELIIIVDNSTTTEGGEAEEHPFNLKTDFLAKFLVFKDIYDIGNGLIGIIASDAAYAYDFELASVVGAGGDAAVASYALEEGDEVLAADESVMLMSSGAPSIPSIEINMGASESNYGYNYGATTAVIDFAWYTPYKATVDNLLSGFLWLGYAWLLFKKAPGLIGGVGLTSERGEDIDAGRKGGGKR